MKIIKREITEIIHIEYESQKGKDVDQYLENNNYTIIGWSINRKNMIVKAQRLSYDEVNINENIEL